MNIEQIEQKCAETLLDYAIVMCNAYVDDPEDFNAAVGAKGIAIFSQAIRDP